MHDKGRRERLPFLRSITQTLTVLVGIAVCLLVAAEITFAAAARFPNDLLLPSKGQLGVLQPRIRNATPNKRSSDLASGRMIQFGAKSGVPVDQYPTILTNRIGRIAAASLVEASGAPSISIVEAPTTGNGCSENQGGNTLNIGTPNAITTPGDTLILLVSGIVAGTNVTSISNGSGNPDVVWTQVPGVQGADPTGGAGGEDIWLGTNIPASTNGAAFTVNTTSTNTFVGACLFEVSGLAGSGVIDQAAEQDDTNPATDLLSPSIGGNTQPELVVALSACEFIGNDTAPEGGITFTPINGGDGNGVGGCPAGYFISSSTGTFQAGLVQLQTGIGVVGIVSLKAAAGATSTATPTATMTGSATMTATPTATPTPTPIATPMPGPASLRVTPKQLNFGSLDFGSGTSKTKSVTVFNPSHHGSPAAFSKIVPDGDFALDENSTTCSGPLLARSKCSVVVRFAPTSTGSRSGTLTIFDSARNSPQVVKLRGRGVTK